jgi:hypothetical protein
MCGREAKFSLSLHCFSAGVYILFQSLNRVFIASLQSPFVLCDSRALPRTCFNKGELWWRKGLRMYGSVRGVNSVRQCDVWALELVVSGIGAFKVLP